MWEYVFLTIVMVVMMGVVVMMWRNQAVYAFRTELLKRISAKANEDIGKGRDFEWRYKMLDSVTYDEMVTRFWKDLFKFYDLKVLLGDEKPKEL